MPNLRFGNDVIFPLDPSSVAIINDSWGTESFHELIFEILFLSYGLVDYRRYKGKSAVVSVRDRGMQKVRKRAAAFTRHTGQNEVLYTLLRA